jgi:hypothetical protein
VDRGGEQGYEMELRCMAGGLQSRHKGGREGRRPGPASTSMRIQIPEPPCLLSNHVSPREQARHHHPHTWVSTVSRATAPDKTRTENRLPYIGGRDERGDDKSHGLGIEDREQT